MEAGINNTKNGCGHISNKILFMKIGSRPNYQFADPCPRLLLA
jgi:hypothetical protein